MKYDNLVNITNENFRRLTGVKRNTFIKMVEILKEAFALKKALGGRPNKLSIEDQLLMALEYLREYRTYFHIAQSYGLSESVCFRNIRWVENTLATHPDFQLSSKEVLIAPPKNGEENVILIDATESPIERPKKKIRKNIIQERRKDTLLKPKLL